MQIETERLLIRPWRLDDVPHYRAMSVDVGYNCFATPGIYLVRDEAEARARVQDRMDRFESRGLGKFPLFERGTGRFIGTCGADPFRLDDGTEGVELGYRLMLEAWGQGYATEAARALLGYLHRDLGLATVYGFALAQNAPSVRVLQKTGFRDPRDFVYSGLPHRIYQHQEPRT